MWFPWDVCKNFYQTFYLEGVNQLKKKGEG